MQVDYSNKKKSFQIKNDRKKVMILVDKKNSTIHDHTFDTNINITKQMHVAVKTRDRQWHTKIFKLLF